MLPHYPLPHLSQADTQEIQPVRCSLLSRICLWAICIKNFLFWLSPRFSTSQPQSPKPRVSHSLPTVKTSPGYTWPQLLVTNFLSANPPQYESNHHEQHLLATTSKISHCLPHLQITKLACDYKFHTTSYPTPKANPLWTDHRRSKKNHSILLGQCQKILHQPSTPKIFTLLIPISNKKMKS